MQGPLAIGFVYLLAIVVAVPLAKRAGLGSVLGYLVAGVLLGPHVLGLLGESSQDVMHFAEFGVVMMLFLVGLELRPALLLRLKTPILGLGGSQVAGTVLVVGLGFLLLKQTWQTALVVGCILAMSSTAIALQSMAEKGWLKSSGGQNAFSILLFQDLAVIPMLALFPLLASASLQKANHANASNAAAAHGESGGHAAEVAGLVGLPGWAQALVMIGAVVGVVVIGRFASRPIFRFIAGSKLREVFTAFALLLVVGVSLLMTQVGLSPALGAFLGGVVLADSEYRHELENDIEPFKGLLMGVFFISVGAGIDLKHLAANPLLVLGGVAAIMALKAMVLLAIGKAFRLSRADTLLLAFGLCQVGEFAFVLIGLTAGLGLLPGDLRATLTSVVALSMAMTPVALLAYEKMVLPRMLARQAGRSGREMDAPEEGEVEAIVAGAGRVGNSIVRLLRANGVKTSVLDSNPDTVDALRKVGLHAWYGDAARPDLLHAAGAAHAKVLIIAIDDVEKTKAIADEARHHYPHLKILLRTSGPQESYAFLNDGYDHVFRETFGTSLEMGEMALRLVGRRAYQAHRAVTLFRKVNEKALRELAQHAGAKGYFERLRDKISETEALFRSTDALSRKNDAGWDNATIREEVRRRLADAKADKS